MRNLKLIMLLAALSAFSLSAESKARIPFGDREVLTKVADLPDTEEYKTEDGTYIDLATLHREFNIAYILPLYVEEEPQLVGYDGKSDTYYNLTESQLNAILKANNLDGKKLNKLGFYTRYGGKIVGAGLVALIIWGWIPSRKKKKNVTPTEV